MRRVFFNGLSTGFILQLAIGPVFFFILNLAMQRTLLDGVCAVAAVTLVDYAYIVLAVVGVGQLLERPRTKKLLGLISAVVLVIFGLVMFVSARNMLAHTALSTQNLSNYWSSFLAAFALTISSPLTIVFWTSLFAAKAVEYGYTKRQLVMFGASAGLATLLFLGSAVVVLSIFKASIPLLLVKILNGLVGVVLMTYGVIRGLKVIKPVVPEAIGDSGA